MRKYAIRRVKTRRYDQTKRAGSGMRILQTIFVLALLLSSTSAQADEARQGFRSGGGVNHWIPPGLENPALSKSLSKWNEITRAAGQLPPKDTLGKLAILVPGLGQSQVISRNLPHGSESGKQDYASHPFDLDGQRSAKEILEQGVGGSCGSYGKVLADALLKSGTDPNRVYLVDTVGESERHAAFKAAQTGESASVSGHQ